MLKELIEFMRANPGAIVVLVMFVCWLVSGLVKHLLDTIQLLILGHRPEAISNETEDEDDEDDDDDDEDDDDDDDEAPQRERLSLIVDRLAMTVDRLATTVDCLHLETAHMSQALSRLVNVNRPPPEGDQPPPEYKEYRPSATQ